VIQKGKQVLLADGPQSHLALSASSSPHPHHSGLSVHIVRSQGAHLFDADPGVKKDPQDGSIAIHHLLRSGHGISGKGGLDHLLKHVWLNEGRKRDTGPRK
jgi:hypothetical protein